MLRHFREIFFNCEIEDQELLFKTCYEFLTNIQKKFKISSNNSTVNNSSKKKDVLFDEDDRFWHIVPNRRPTGYFFLAFKLQLEYFLLFVLIINFFFKY